MNWRRNLAALWFAEFTAIFGFSFAFPFLSIFINQDLGVRAQRENRTKCKKKQAKHR